MISADLDVVFPHWRWDASGALLVQQEFFLNSTRSGSVLKETKGQCQSALMWLFQGHGKVYVQHLVRGSDQHLMLSPNGLTSSGFWATCLLQAHEHVGIC